MAPALAVAVSATALLVQALVACGTVALAEGVGDGWIESADADADGSGETAGADEAVFGVPDAGAVDPHATQVEMTHAKRPAANRRILTLGPLRMTRPTP